ncbi:MAG TPA: transglycosylase SLT domain-containing protein [Candidatus Dormibacteraeota bacterium]|nr:transglycosylase SLT domain-containing protein [Candidatus Dormibacteraeota bacterium]
MDTEKGSHWSARDLKKATYPRRLTHLLIMAVAVIPVTLTAAAAHPAPVAHPRIQLVATVQDHPENFRQIPADPPAPVAAPVAAPVPAPPPPPPPPRPAPKPVAYIPAPVVVPASRAQIAAMIRAAAARYGANGDQMVRVAMCESGLNPNARNASGASGLFQFKPGTFYGNGGHNLWDPADQADVAARMFARGQAGQWSCR